MKSIFSTTGLFAVLGLFVGLVIDIRSVDRTSGGYDYPFADWSGKTIDFSAMYKTDDGLYQRGYVVDQYFNCTTGMISWNILGVMEGEFRRFSERAIVVHKPQDECRARGFNADAWAISDLL
jgi:F0F1-type ATP synthase assembly protein I